MTGEKHTDPVGDQSFHGITQCRFNSRPKIEPRQVCLAVEAFTFAWLVYLSYTWSICSYVQHTCPYVYTRKHFVQYSSAKLERQTYGPIM